MKNRKGFTPHLFAGKKKDSASGKKGAGFTLIELLVVIAIIGLLATLSVVALNNARQKSRDAKRVSDIKQIQTALELYFVDNSGYPISAVAGANLGDAALDVLCDMNTQALGDGIEAAAGDCDGTIYMGQIPLSPKPPNPQEYYVYCSFDTSTGLCSLDATAARGSYQIAFDLEGITGSLPAGNNCATPDGIMGNACP